MNLALNGFQPSLGYPETVEAKRSIWDILHATMETPDNFGWFHILALTVIVFAAVMLCRKFHGCDDRTYRRIIFIGWLIMAVLEVYRQIVFAFSLEEAVWDYAWYQFPFQLCSTPLYVMPFIVFLKDGRLRDALMAYTSTFAFFGGLAVMCYPNDVFISMIGINIQTMIAHGMQFVLGIFTAVHNYERSTHKYFLRSIPVFLVLLSMAVAMNFAAYEIFMARGMDDTFNMFFISPYFDCSLPILSAIQDVAPYPVFLSAYAFGFIGIAALMFYGQRMLIRRITEYNEKRKKQRQTKRV